MRLNHTNILVRPRHLRGMTLLELVLALALAGLLLMAVSMALHIHWKAFDVRRARVEEAQLARALLRNIGDDLRCTLKFEEPNLEGLNLSSIVPTITPPDTETPDTKTPDTKTPDTKTPDTKTPDTKTPDTKTPDTKTPDTKTPDSPAPDEPGPNPGPNQDSSGGSPDSSEGGGTTGGATTSEAAPSVVVGLYGTATQLQFDVSRLPRVDQYQATGSADGMSVEIPSDIKTVVYFLRSDESLAADGALAGGSVEPGSTGTGAGLMRAESDRAVSAWGEMNGSPQSLYGGAKLLAQEVTSLQFQYFDGTEWLTEWNSDDQGGLPLAIEVQLTIASSQTATNSTGSAFVGSSLMTGETTGKVYRMVVQLPVGGVTPKTEESTEMPETPEPDPMTIP